MYAADKQMENEAFQNADGDFLIVLQEGGMNIRTEFGILCLMPGEIALIPQGIRFSVNIKSALAVGYILEVYGSHFELPDLGPIGANGLANPRDFLCPVAALQEEIIEEFKIINKFQNKFYEALQNHTCFDVAGWHGNYVPYKYDLSKFVPVNNVAVDHADPSIFTVLTCQSLKAGTAVADFVIFPPRWSVSENTFRPPYYHRNCMTELMGLIFGDYEAKQSCDNESGFFPGGISLHSIMTPHGPDEKCFTASSNAKLQPEIIGSNSLAFMFESYYHLSLSKWALNNERLDKKYINTWKNLASLNLQ
uniref:Homogentisate 1,2-dioxygenase n=1 Tax=Lepeophtheirus salmonis TaxID=72036 RepID=D3PK56_LEPSM|nr:Homogentisate 1,2-dioxygenase [Lepeophtheirus salmonis]